MSKQIGRIVFKEPQTSKYDIRLSWFRKVKKKYYEFHIMLIDGRAKRFAGFSDYRLELFNAAVYEKQAYLYKIESLYSKQALRNYERRAGRG